MTEKVKAGIEKCLNNKSDEIRNLFLEIREILVHHDERITEDIKWGMPSYDFKTIVLGLGAFKNHVSIWFHKGAIMSDDMGLFEPGDNKEMRQIKYSSGDKINIEGIKSYFAEAIAINDAGIKIKKEKIAVKKTFVDSADFMKELVNHKQASSFFNGLTTNQQNHFTSFIEEAKQQATKQRRIEKVIDRLTQGFKTTH